MYGAITASCERKASTVVLLVTTRYPADMVLLCLQPRILHVNSVSDAIENVTLMYCPPDRRVQVEVPLKVSHSQPGK